MESAIHLDTAYLHVTRACNLHCVYCYFSAGIPDKRELSTRELRSVMEEVSKLKPQRVVITGGEALLRADIFELAMFFKKMNSDIPLSITTNGTLITAANSYSLVQNFDEIRISIDGFREVNDALRGLGAFEKAINAFRHILQAGGDPVAFITVTNRNFHQIKAFMDFLLSNGILKLHLSPLKLAGRAQDETLLCEANALEREVEDFWFSKFNRRLGHAVAKTDNCGVGKYLTVYPDGSVYPCHLLAFPEFYLGNVREESLYRLFQNSQTLNTLRNLKSAEIAQCLACMQETASLTSCLGTVARDLTSRDKLSSLVSSSNKDKV